ncbi:aquaporin-like protein [Cladochytrium replicatum]|nr:aquaporin-like protein [Cladochytrium replicatum]
MCGSLPEPKSVKPADLKSSSYTPIATTRRLGNFQALALQSLGEFLGTFFFLFIGLGSVPAAAKYDHPAASFITISLAFGLGLAISVFIFYRISGGVFNPALSVALFATGHFSLVKAGAYIVSQLAGAEVAALAVKGLFSAGEGVTYSLANKLNGIGPIQAIVAEALLTAPLGLLVYFLAVDKARVTFLAPFFIGLYVATAHLVLSPYTGTSLNPARSLAGSLVSAEFPDHYVFWAGPILGALLSAGIYKLYSHFDYTQLNGDQDAESDGAIRLPA